MLNEFNCILQTWQRKILSLLAEGENILSVQLHTEFIKNEKTNELAPLGITWPNF